MTANDRRIDTDTLRQAMPIQKLIEACGVELKKHGTELRALCPFHDEQTPSFSVTPGKDTYYCFGCGAGGDHFRFLQDYYSESFVDAAKRLQDLAGGVVANDNSEPRQRQAPDRQQEPPKWQRAMPPADEPAPTSLPRKIDGQWRDVPVVGAWAYRDIDGNLVGYTLRIEPEPGKKDVMPVTWQTSTATGEQKWRQGSLEVPRLLYGAELLAHNPSANIILVEGEKAADAARRMLVGKPVIVMTWPGGCKAVDKADWSMLRGRKVVAWPDCDSQVDKRTGEMRAYDEQPGMAAMLAVASHASQYGFEIRIVEIPHPGDIEDGWDLADAEAEGWDGDRVLATIKQSVRTVEQIKQLAEPEPEPETPANDNEPPAPGPDDYGYDDLQDDGPSGQPFRVLGWDRTAGYYLPAGSQQVMSLSASAHTKLNLMSMAPLRYWQEWYPSTKRSGDPVDWSMAADSLMRQAQREGIYDPEMVRGLGAWWDRDRPAVHLGDKVIIDGQAHALMDAPTDYVYEAARKIRIATDGALNNADAFKLVQICENLRWERPMFGKLLAGWVFLAPICGGLQWRPHIWVTGESGSGKSTVMSHVIHRCLRRTMVFVQGDTSEAGVRQDLGHHALPVVFDEFEGERKKAAERVEDVLALVTQASSETGAKLLKGGAQGKATSFQIRSMFAFSSIAVNIKQHAARNRITVLSLRPAGDETPQGLKQYQDMMETIQTTLTPEYIDRLQARAVSLMPVIRKNAEVFAEAGAMVLKTRRLGDQIGALLAGAYALHSTAEITREKAMAWLEQQDWSEETETNETSDKEQCMQHILSHVMRLQVGEHGKPAERTIGELIGKVCGLPDWELSGDEAEAALGRIGIRIEETPAGVKMIAIANGHKAIERILDGTAWKNSYSRTLLRISGAERSGKVMNFKGARARAAMIPAHAFIDLPPVQARMV